MSWRPTGRSTFADWDGFAATVNSRALAEAGIARGQAAQTGRVAGDAMRRIRSVIPHPSEAQYREALRRTTAMANRRRHHVRVRRVRSSPDLVAAYEAADRAGELTVRVVAAQRVDPARGPEQVDAMIARRDAVRGRRFRADAAKIFLDGEIDRHSAAMLSPYADAPNVRGALFLPQSRLNAIVARLDAAGFTVHMHAMGDGAVRAGLDAVAFAIRANGPRDRRHQIAHVGVADPADIPRFGALGVTAVFTPLWFTASDPDAAPTDAALGPKRSQFVFPLAGAARAGGRIVAGSDWPSTDMSPLAGMAAAITRAPPDGSLPPRQPGQRTDFATILAAYTRNAAWAAREDAEDGTIAPGKAADLVVLDRDPFAVAPAELVRVRVLATLIDGEPVFRDPTFAW